MTRVYVDPSAILLGPARAGAGGEHVAPRAAEAVARLVDSGFEVVVLGLAPGDLEGLATMVAHLPSLPEQLEADAWFLTAEPHPSFGRPRGGTTVLVGPRRPPGKVPRPRFDVEARDIASAAMEILTRQAMA